MLPRVNIFNKDNDEAEGKAHLSPLVFFAFLFSFLIRKDSYLSLVRRKHYSCKTFNH